MSKYWLTPPELYEQFNNEFNFDFDPCPYPRTYNGLECEWGHSNYVNPLFFDGITKWIRKGIEEYRKGKKIVFILPLDNWVKLLLDEGAKIRVIGNVNWIDAEDRTKMHRSSRPNFLFILD